MVRNKCYFCFLLGYLTVWKRAVVYLFPFCFEVRDMGSESEKELFNQFTMYVFPELMLVFAYISFPFGFDARLLGPIVT